MDRATALRAALIKKNMGYAELAAKIKMSSGALWNIATGLSPGHRSNLTKMDKVLGTNLSAHEFKKREVDTQGKRLEIEHAIKRRTK